MTTMGADIRTWQILAVVTALWAGIYLPGLGSTELKGEEARRLLPGVEMLRSGDWVVPRVAGLPYSRKPPLINWAAATSFKISGVINEWSGRFPSVLSVLAVSLGAAWMMSRWWSAEAGLLAAVFLLTNISFFDKGRLAEIEPIFIALFGLGLLAWMGGWLSGRTPWARWPVALFFQGAAFLAKGPIHLLFFYAIVGGILFQARRLKELAHPAHLVGWGIFLATVAPWVLLNQQRNPSGDSSAHWRDALLSRLTFQEIDWGTWLLQPPQAILNFLPWTLLLPLLWFRGSGESLETKGETSRSLFRGTRWGIVFSFCLIMILPSSRPRFVMPLIVPVSVLLAMVLCELRGLRRERVLRSWRWACLAAAVGVTLGAAAIPFLNSGASWGMRLLPAAGVAGGGGLLIAAIHAGRSGLAPGALALLSGWILVLATGIYAFGVIPLMGEHENVRPFAHEIRERAGEDARLVVYGAGFQPFVFYLGENTLEVGRMEDLPPPEEVDRVLSKEDLWSWQRLHLEPVYGEIEAVESLTNPREIEGRNRYRLMLFER